MWLLDTPILKSTSGLVMLKLNIDQEIATVCVCVCSYYLVIFETISLHTASLLDLNMNRYISKEDYYKNCCKHLS